MPTVDSFSLLLGAAVGAIGLATLFSVLIGIAYRESALFLLAALGMLNLVFLLIGGTVSDANQDQAAWRAWSILIYFLSMAGSLILPVLLLGRSGASWWPARALYALSAGMVLFSVAFIANWGVAEIGVCISIAWIAFMAWYLAINWPSARPWITWLALGQAALWLVWIVHYVMELGWMESSQRQVIGVYAIGLALFVVSSYLSIVWRSRLLSHERLKTELSATRDALTGLSVRTVFCESLSRVGLRAARLGYSGGVMVICVKNLAEYSASIGKDNSEHSLMGVARILSQSTRPHDLVARISDQNFAVLLDGMTKEYNINALATKFISAGLRLATHNPEGIGLNFAIVVMPLKGVSGLGSEILQAMLDELQQIKSQAKPICTMPPYFAPNSTTPNALLSTTPNAL
jgi:diguanylate cyclase (GGDEF)-like protein